MSKLPFVWELNCNGINSFAIGTKHICTEFATETMQAYLQGKKHLLLELPVTDELLQLEISKRHNDTRLPMEIALYHAAKQLGIPCVHLETPAEYWATYKLIKKTWPKVPNDTYDQTGNDQTCNESADAFLSGDLELELRRLHQSLYGKPGGTELLKDQEERNRRMVARSMAYLPTGCTIAVGLAHLIQPPSMLQMYESSGIGVKRVQ